MSSDARIKEKEGLSAITDSEIELDNSSVSSRTEESKGSSTSYMQPKRGSQLTDLAESELGSSDINSALDQGLGMIQKLDDKNFATTDAFFKVPSSAASTD